MDKLENIGIALHHSRSQIDLLDSIPSHIAVLRSREVFRRSQTWHADAPELSTYSAFTLVVVESQTNRLKDAETVALADREFINRNVVEKDTDRQGRSAAGADSDQNVEVCAIPARPANLAATTTSFPVPIDGKRCRETGMADIPSECLVSLLVIRRLGRRVIFGAHRSRKSL
ncbi:hypothetical protein KC347_g177 [Hortaea werneckii]|nr:hypothetical protein KC347_g177 [Hortaea werneckii]